MFSIQLAWCWLTDDVPLEQDKDPLAQNVDEGPELLVYLASKQKNRSYMWQP